MKRDPITAAAFQRLLGTGIEAVDAGGNGCLQRGRHRDLRHIRAADISASAPFENPAFGELAKKGLPAARLATRSLIAATEGSAPKGPSSSAVVSESVSGASEIVCAPGI